MIKERIITKRLIENTSEYSIQHKMKITEFGGCQCFKDCSCNDDFTPELIENFRLRTKQEPRKTFNLNSYKECLDKIRELNLEPGRYIPRKNGRR